MSLDTSEGFDRLLASYSVRRLTPRPVDVITRELNVLGLAEEFYVLYMISNGLNFGRFRMLPIESSEDPKRTWDSLQRANNPKLSKYLGADVGLLKRLAVFADIGFGDCAAFDRQEPSIWYEEDGELHQTQVTLLEFLETNLREAAEL